MRRNIAIFAGIPLFRNGPTVQKDDLFAHWLFFHSLVANLLMRPRHVIHGDLSTVK
jgi:hypothetical protein